MSRRKPIPTRNVATSKPRASAIPPAEISRPPNGGPSIPANSWEKALRLLADGRLWRGKSSGTMLKVAGMKNALARPKVAAITYTWASARASATMRSTTAANSDARTTSATSGWQRYLARISLAPARSGAPRAD
jgi:hypothetical protein